MSSDTARAADRLTEQWRTWDDEAVIALLTARPDLASPRPAGLAAMAVRALSPTSLREAVERLDAPHLWALEAVTSTGTTTSTQAVADLLGTDAGTAGTLLDDLRRLALVDEGWSAPQVVAAVVGSPAGLAPSAPEDARAPVDHLDDLLSTAPAGAADVLASLTWGPYAGTVDPSGPLGTAVAWLIDSGLLRSVSDDGSRVVLPRPVAMALRGGRLHREDVAAPHPAMRHRTPATVDAAAGAAAAEVLDLMEELGDLWGHEPPRVLRAGGVAVRDLARTAAHLNLDTHMTSLLLEVAHAALLVADDGGAEPVWAPTHEFDTWRDRPEADRWAALAAAWLAMPRAPHRTGARIDDVTVNALAAGGTWAGIPRLRRQVLDVLAEPAPGSALDADSVVTVFSWRHPRQAWPRFTDAVRAVLAEAETLGVTSGGALSTAGRALLTGEDPEPVAATVVLPAPVSQIVLQADLTAIAPGRLTTPVAAFLRRAATTESRGGARLFRFTPQSLTGLFDDGWSVDDALAMLVSISATPVPQPLDYLLHDVARRHGTTRVGAAGAYVRSEDTAVLDVLASRPELAAAGLRRIAPTVLVSPLSPTRLVAILRSAEVSILVEGADGALISGASAPARAATPRSRQVRATPSPDVPAVVAALRRADGGSADGRSTSDPAMTAAWLREAAESGVSVRIEVVGPSGASATRTVRPSGVSGGLLRGVDADGRSGSWPLHRIRSVAL